MSAEKQTGFSRMATIQMTSQDPDEQFILDIVRETKQESIQSLIDNLRLQESKSYMMIRLLERYKEQLENTK
jgi:ribosomal 50S subunit-associated protein YjgA (DUF615 family)